MSEDTILRVDDYAESVRTLSADSFSQRHGEAFLVHLGIAADLRPPPRAQPTLNEITNVKASPMAPAPARKGGAASGFLVFEVRSTGRSPFPNIISVGRTRNNDIVLPDVSVSKLHAFFTRGRDGRLQIQDAGSRNGTWVGGIAAPGRDAPPMSLTSLAELRFGSVEMSFLLATEFRRFVQRMCG
jgi:hypothetical protein